MEVEGWREGEGRLGESLERVVVRGKEGGRERERGGGRAYFASILRQIAAYLSDFCSRTKPSTTFLGLGGEVKGGWELSGLVSSDV